MGVAIVVMTALLVLGLSLGWNKKSGDTASATGGNPVAAVPRVDTGENQGGVPAATIEGGGPAPLDITVPRDAAIYTITGDGKLIALHVRSPGGDEVIVVDTSKNLVVSRIRLVPEGGAAP